VLPASKALAAFFLSPQETPTKIFSETGTILSLAIFLRTKSSRLRMPGMRFALGLTPKKTSCLPVNLARHWRLSVI
jgi:hypothetical protein